MRQPADLTREDLEAIVTDVRDALYVEEGALNPDREWNADTCQNVADVLHRYDLAPSETTPIDQIGTR